MAKKSTAKPAESEAEEINTAVTPSSDAALKNVMITVPPETHNRLKVLSGLCEMTMGEMVAKALAEYLAKEEFEEAMEMYTAVQASMRAKVR